MKRKFWALLSLLVVFSMVLGACKPAEPTATPKPKPTVAVKPTEPPAPAEPIKIAILGPLTGDVATFGASNRDGAIMAFEEWNAKGGILGRPIEWVLGDTQCDPKAAADAGKKAIDEDKVKYILGAVCSSATIPISEYANEKGVLQMSATSTNPMVTVDKDGNTKPYIFRACFIDPFQGSVMAKFALENLGAKTAAVVLDVGNDYIKGLAEYFKAAFEAGGGEVVVWEAFVKEDTDFSAILAKVKAAGPDVFFIPTYYEKMNLIALQAKQKGITAVLLGGDGWDSPDLDRAAADGGYHSNHYSPEDSRAIVQDFVSKYEAQFGAVPDALAALGYDAANMLCQAIANAGVDDPAKVKDAMAALEFEAVSGKITFDEFHNPVKNAAILHIKDGEVLFETSVSPAAPPAAGEPIKIAILGPLTGDVATFGASNRDGAIMAFEEWNAKGGILGRPIEWVLGDTQCDPKAAADAGKKAIDEDKVKYILGAVCSSATIPISEYANGKGVLQMSATSTNPMVTVDKDGNTKPYIFRACFIDPFQGSVMAKFALENLGAKTAAVVLDVGNDYIKGLAEYFKAAFEAGGGEVVVWEAFVKEDTDFSAILAKVKAAGPDVFFIPTYYEKMNLIALQAKQKGITAVLLGGDGWDSPDLDRAAADGGYHSNHYSPEDSRAIVQDFVSKYEAQFGAVPDALAALGYDAANMLCQAIANAGVDDPAKVKDAMAALEFEAVSGKITFDEFHNPVKNAAILHIKDGEVLFETSVSPAAPPAAGEPIKIAILGPLTGDVATFGASNRDGAIMAFEEWNAKGGILGRPIEWVLGDTQCDPKAAADAGKKAIDEDKVKYILGAVCSSATIPISEYANGKGVLQMSATSTNPMVTVDKDGNTKPYIFRACFIDPFQGSVMAKFALENLGAKTAAVVLDVGNDYIKGLAEYFKAAFEAGGGEVVVWEAFVKEDTDFSAILAKVKAAGPDVFFIPTYYEKMNLIALQAKQKGITAVLLGGDGWDSPDLDRAAADGGYHSNHYSPEDSRAIVQDFVSKYEAQFGAVPDALAALGYDAANMLCQAIANAGVDDPAKVKDAMAALEYEAVSGLITFDEFHNPVKNAAILHIKDGKVLFEASVSP